MACQWLAQPTGTTQKLPPLGRITNDSQANMNGYLGLEMWRWREHCMAPPLYLSPRLSTFLTSRLALPLLTRNRNWHSSDGSLKLEPRATMATFYFDSDIPRSKVGVKEAKTATDSDSYKPGDIVEAWDVRTFSGLIPFRQVQ